MDSSQQLNGGVYQSSQSSGSKNGRKIGPFYAKTSSFSESDIDVFYGRINRSRGVVLENFVVTFPGHINEDVTHSRSKHFVHLDLNGPNTQSTNWRNGIFSISM